MNMMNAGLSALMPGQAAPNMAGVLPQPSQAAPNAVPSHVDALARLPFEQLQALYRDPPKEVPAYAVIAARDKQIRDAQTRKAYQDMMAQQQVAGQQGTVADNVMAVRAAGGGEMRVQGFQFGGAPRAETLFPVDGVPIYKPREGPERGESREQYEARKKREAAEADEVANRLLRRAYRGITDYLSTPASERLPIVDALIQGSSRGLPAAAQATQQPTPSTTPAVSPAAQRRTAQVSGRRGQAAAPLEEAPPPPDAGLRAGADALAGAGKTPPPAATQRQSQVPAFDINKLISAINATGVIPPEILEERKALEAARKAQLERQQAAAKRYGAVLEESPEDRRMRAFAAIAKGLSSSPRLSKGLSAALSELVGSETEARRARREGMKEVMTLEDAAANLQIAMRQQALADATGDNKLKTAAALARAQALRDFQKATIEQIRQQQLADAESKRAEAALITAGKTGSSDSSLRTQQRLALQSQITALEDRAKDLARPEAERRAAEQQAAKLRRRMNALLELETGSGATEPKEYDFDLTTGKLVPSAK